MKCLDDQIECKGFDSNQHTCIPKIWMCDGEVSDQSYKNYKSNFGF